MKAFNSNLMCRSGKMTISNRFLIITYQLPNLIYSFQAFLKRLQAAKPTPGLKRSEQLADYQRQAGYPRGPSYPICVSTINKGRSTSKTPTGR